MIITELSQVPDNLPEVLYLKDHIGGFDCSFNNQLLNKIDSDAKRNGKIQSVQYHQYLDDNIKSLYKNLQIGLCTSMQHDYHTRHFEEYNIHLDEKFQNFICSFNGSPHVSRKLLVSILYKFGMFDSAYSTKNFPLNQDNLYGHIADYVNDRELSLYSKFFLPLDENFLTAIYAIDYTRFNHKKNIHTLSGRISRSFLHLVSETLATSYYPYVTEKSFYSIVTRRLFVSYAQPNWHSHLEQYYGFKKYDVLFDYTFDRILNPVRRLVELITMVSKYSNMSSDDWRDLYLLEQDTIEFNYDHYFSGDYLRHFKRFE